MNNFEGIDPFYNLIGCGQNLLKCLSFCKPIPKCKITAVGAKCSGYHVSNPSGTKEGLSCHSKCNAKVNQFSQSPCDQKGLHVFAKSHTFTHTRRNGNDIFECPSNFHTFEIMATKNSEILTHQNSLTLFDHFIKFTGYDRCRR